MHLRTIFCTLILLTTPAVAQDSALASLRVRVLDPTGARVAAASLKVTALETNARREARADARGESGFDGLSAGEYAVEVSATGFATQKQKIALAVGDAAEIVVKLTIGPASETVSVKEDATAIETTPAGISTVISEREIGDLPVNGRRFTDLALLTPQAVQDPRSLTSTSNGDLAFGGIRGFNTTYVVDGADNNNGFFGQSHGRLRAPYQFSNETIKEFRVSTNTFGVEQGRSSGAVVNVITKSGTNTHHGSMFYYLRDGKFAATHPFVRKKYPDKQHQFGFSVGGPLKPDKIFYFAGFDQHIFHVPTVVQFLNGQSTVVPGAKDFEFNDQALVEASAAQLSLLGGQFRSELGGATGFAKFDFYLSPRHRLTSRVNVSRYYGANNVFSDPTSPISNFGVSGNGEEDVTTTTITNNLLSSIGSRWLSQARAQWSRDEQSSRANSDEVSTKVQDIISGFGRSSILPRRTNEDRFQLAETASYQNARHAVKAGADMLFTKTMNYFPRQYGGQYIFDTIKVNPFTFKPQLAGLPLTPLRAYAHQVPRYYIQDFGEAESHPDTNDFAFFLQDTIRLGDHLALSLGTRYDVQTFRRPPLPVKPLWPDAGKMPADTNNIAPRIGLAASFGDRASPFVLRGGYGIFFTRIPQIYNSTVEIENGTRSHLFLDNSNSTQRPFFPAYPLPLVNCTAGTLECKAPASVAPFLSTTVSSFADDYRTPYVQQGSFSLQKQVATRTDVTLSYLFVGGRHLIRSRDVNLPQPKIVKYPVYDETGSTFTGTFDEVSTFATCCFTDPARPISKLGPVNVFETAASSDYHGFTVSAERRMTSAFSARLGYTWAKAIDDTQDALVAGRPTQVENSFKTERERALSVTDQRHRFIASFITEPNPFGRDHALLAKFFNDWKLSGIFSAGSGRPLSGLVDGDANRDGNFGNDRLPGASRNSFTGPDYFSGDARITRRFHLTEQWRIEAMAEAFNVFNRANQRVETSDDGYSSLALKFVTTSKTIQGIPYAAHFEKQKSFLQPTNAYSPRQVQFSLRLKW